MFKWFKRVVSLILIVFVIYFSCYILGAVKVYKKAYLIQYDSEIEYFDSKSPVDKMLMVNMAKNNSLFSPCRALNVYNIDNDYTEEELKRYLPVILFAYKTAQDDFIQIILGAYYSE